MDYKSILDLLITADFYVAVAALLAVLKGIAELLEKIGRIRLGRYWEYDAAGKALWFTCETGKIVNFIAPGNKKVQPGIVLRFLQVIK